MKKAILFLLSIFCWNSVAQTYQLDPSFGDNGIMRLGFSNSQAFVASLQVDDRYFFITAYGDINSLMADGSNLHVFETGVFLKEIKRFGNSVFACGHTDYNGGNLVIAKTDLDGNPDPAFGTNGKKVIDLGGLERLFDIEMTSDGNLICGGNRYFENVASMITIKINASTGEIMPNTDSTQFRSYLYIGSGLGFTSSGFLQPYNGNYLLMGTSGGLAIIAIDENGIVNTAFGDNGYKLIPGIDYLKNLEMVGDKLYGNYEIGSGSLYTYRNLFCYDLATDQMVFNNDNGGDGVHSFKIYPEGIYTTAKAYLNPMATRKYILKRKNFDGTNDTSFNGTGSFMYDSPSVFSDSVDDYFQDEAQTVIKLENGDFFIGGYTRWHNGSTNFFGRTLIKITPQVLSVNSQTKSQVSLSPNPFQDKLSVTSDAAINDITVYDLSGRIILKPRFKSGKQITIDVSEIKQKGIYLMELATKDGSFTKKIIKG